MSLWIRLCNHTYIHTYIHESGGGHAESNPRPSQEGVSFCLVLRPLDTDVPTSVRLQMVGPLDPFCHAVFGAFAGSGDADGDKSACLLSAANVALTS